jgi:hypothetical protein
MVITVAAVAEPQSLVVAAGARDDRQGIRIHRRSGAGQWHGEGLQGVDPTAQPRRQDLLELGKRPDRGLLDPGHRAARGHA